MMRLKVVAVALLFALGVHARAAEPVKAANRYCSERVENALRLSSKLKTGMTPEQVRSILGEPENSDQEYIWVWTNALVPHVPRMKWTQILETGDWNYMVYLLFRDGKLRTQVLVAGDTTPWDSFAYLWGPPLRREVAERILGESERAPEASDRADRSPSGVRGEVASVSVKVRFSGHNRIVQSELEAVMRREIARNRGLRVVESCGEVIVDILGDRVVEAEGKTKWYVLTVLIYEHPKQAAKERMGTTETSSPSARAGGGRTSPVRIHYYEMFTEREDDFADFAGFVRRRVESLTLSSDLLSLPSYSDAECLRD